jgi:hypothetical protein
VKSEPYVPVPRRFGQALLRGEMTDRTYSVGCFLCDAADYKTGLYVGTLAAIADGMQWTGSHDTLTRSLARLKEGAWIDFESMRGKRKPYEIRLTGLLVRDRLTHDLRTNPPRRAYVSYAAPSTTSLQSRMARGIPPPQNFMERSCLRAIRGVLVRRVLGVLPRRCPLRCDPASGAGLRAAT